MAFFNRISCLVRQNVSTNNSLNGTMFNTIRSMSSSKLFIGGLSYQTDEQSLKDAFSSFGEVVDAKVITDRDSGRSRGFGFVNYVDVDSASSALSAMDGQDLNGRAIRVSYATERAPRTDGYGGGGSYGGGGGNYSGGYGGDRDAGY